MRIWSIIAELGRLNLIPEGDGWVLLRQAERCLEGADPAELLDRTADLPDTLRYGLSATAETFLLGEVHDPSGDNQLTAAEIQLKQTLQGKTDAREPEGELVEAALESAGVRWERRESSWAVPPTVILPRALLVRPVAGGVRVESVLAEWDEAGDTEVQALARFLCLAQGGVRFARCELEANRALVASFAATVRLEADLAHGLRGVAAGCRLLSREAAALLLPEVARTFLDFVGGPSLGNGALAMVGEMSSRATAVTATA